MSLNSVLLIWKRRAKKFPALGSGFCLAQTDSWLCKSVPPYIFYSDQNQPLRQKEMTDMQSNQSQLILLLDM